MAFNRHLFSSARSDWRTPEAFYQALDAEFHFDFDPCPDRPHFDGLSIEWGLRNYVNPPYQRGVTDKWVKKALEESRKGKLVVMLLPARTDNQWFQDYVLPEARQIRFIRGRLKFKGAEHGAPFPSCIVIFGEPL